MKRAFTLLEVIAVIVIIGVLSAIAIPKFLSYREDAKILELKEDLAVIQSAITQANTEMNMLSWSEKSKYISQGYLMALCKKPAGDGVQFCTAGDEPFSALNVKKMPNFTIVPTRGQDIFDYSFSKLKIKFLYDKFQGKLVCYQNTGKAQKICAKATE